MIIVIVTIKVKNFEVLEKFEREAVKIMHSYNGKTIGVYETERNEDDRGEEVHILEFDSTEDFKNYREDARHLTLNKLRAEGIEETSIKVSSVAKNYE